MATRTARPPQPAEDLSELTDRQLMERMYRELRGELSGLFELAENHAVAIGRVEAAHERTAARVDALITTDRARQAEVKAVRTDLRLAHARVQELERDVEPLKRTRTARNGR